MRRSWIAGLAGLSLNLPGLAAANDLLDSYHLAQQQDQTFQAALHLRDASIEARPQARSVLLPQITAQANYQRERVHVFSSSNPLAPSKVSYFGVKSYGLSLNQVLFDWSAFETLAESDHQVAAAEASFRSAEQSLVYRTAQAYFAVLNAADTLRADLDAQTSFKQQLDQAQKKFEVGLAAITDVRNAQASYDTSSALVIADRQALDSAKRSLGQIIGKPVSDVSGLQDDIPLVAPEPASVEDWTDAAGKDNPDLMSALDTAEAARKAVNAAEGKYLPTVGLGGTLNRQTTHSQFGDDSLTDVIGVSATWNVFQGGLTASQVRQSKATYLQSKAQYEGERRVVDQAARDAYEGVVSGIALVKADKQAVYSNQTSLEATQVGLRVGTRTEIDVLNARQLLAVTQRSYYQSRYAYLSNLLLLKQQAGRLSEADLADIDRLLTSTPATPPQPPSPPATVPPAKP